MIKKFFVIAGLFQLAACGSPVTDLNGNYVGPALGGGTPGAIAGVPAELSADLGAVEYDSVNETLKVTLLPFDGSPVETSYIRDATRDVGGFQAYELQENRKSRKYTALFKAGNASTAGVAGTNFDLANEFGGGTFSRNPEYDAPTTGIATYEGSYAGVRTTTNSATGVGPDRVSGDALLNVDFNDQRTEGWVRNRQIVDGGAALPDLILVQTSVDNGVFFGDVIGEGSGSKYGGNLAGSNADEVAGVVVLGPDPHIEYGAFILPQTCITSPGNTCF